MKLTVDIQTRGRPEKVARVLECMLPNLALDNTTLLVTADDDDQATIDAIPTWPKDPRILVSVEPREDTRGEKFDRALRLAPADVYMPAADTVLINRKGFDAAILEAAQQFPDGIGCVYTPLINASFPGFQCLTAKLVEKLGYIYPRQFPFWFIDHWLDDVVQMIGRYVTVDIESDHFTLRQDTKTHGLKDLEFWTRYFDACWIEREREALSVINSPDFDEPEWRKQALISNFSRVRARSIWINDTVRAQAEKIEAERGSERRDARYGRAKLKARQHLWNIKKRGRMKVGLCIPCYEAKVSDATMSSVARTMVLAAEQDIEVMLIVGRGNPVLPDVRNWCVGQALALGCDKIWFVDADISWDASVPEALNMLRAPADIVAAVHQARNTRWNDPARMVVYWEKIPPEIEPKSGLYKVKKVATAFVCIDRSVFERLAAAGIARNYLPSQVLPEGDYYPFLRNYFWYDFMPVGEDFPENLKEYLASVGYEGPLEKIQGEDYYFCTKAREIGCDIVVDPRVSLVHFDGCIAHDMSMKDVRFQPIEEKKDETEPEQSLEAAE
jgi:hypothetical protein